jgi:hypothetical protein
MKKRKFYMELIKLILNLKYNKQEKYSKKKLAHFYHWQNCINSSKIVSIISMSVCMYVCVCT